MLGTPRISRLGVGLCLAAGLAFAVQPILGTIALDHGAAIIPMLGWRYLIAAIVLAVVARRALFALPLRVALSAFALGLVLYTADSFLFYTALERTSAPFATLLHYGHLAVVVGVAAFTGREKLNAKRLAALVTILGGIALVGGGAVSPDVLGLVFALASAGVYAVYILASDRLLRDIDPIAYSAVLTSGAAVAFMIVGGVNGELTALGGTTGVSVIVVGAFLGSVFALTAFLAGIRLIGPGTASLLVTVEVPFGLTLAAVVLGDRLTTPQLAGAAFVVGAIAMLQVPLPSLERVVGMRGRFLEVRAARRLAAEAA